MTTDIVSAQRELFNPAVLKINEVQRAAAQHLKEGNRRMEENYTHGIFEISNDKYHSLPGISRSAITEFKKSPLHYWDRYLNSEKPEKKESSAMNVGSAVHAMVLQPEIFDQEFAVLEKIDGRTKEGKEYKASFEILSAGKIILKEEEYLLAKNISDSVITHPRASRFLNGAFSVEKSIFWIDSDTGLLCKARPDIWNHDLKLICDLKTTNDPSPEAFIFSIRKNGYHIQAAMQIDAIFETTGEEMEYFTFIAAPNERPFKPYIYVLGKEAIALGRQEYKAALQLLKKCQERQEWDLDRLKPIELEFPAYLLNTNPFHKLLEIYQCQN